MIIIAEERKLLLVEGWRYVGNDHLLIHSHITIPPRLTFRFRRSKVPLACGRQKERYTLAIITAA